MADTQASGAERPSLDIFSPACDSTPTEPDLPQLSTLTISQPVNLLSLPIEIQLVIISHLTIPTNQFLRSTNHHFNVLIPPMTHESLLEAEKSDLARSLNSYACALCLRLRRPGHFADAFRKSAYDRDHKDGKQEKRFCIDCGVKGKDSSMKYQWGDSWTRFGLPYVKCRVCRLKKRGAKERKDCSMCAPCWEKKNEKR